MKKTRKRNKVFIVEDDGPTVEVYQIAFNQEGFELEVAIWGDQAIQEIKKIQEGKRAKPDIVLIDLMLPDMNGLDIIEFMKSRSETKDIPVFVLTNYGDEEMEKIGYDLKSERHILKANFTPREIVKMVKDRLKEK